MSKFSQYTRMCPAFCETVIRASGEFYIYEVDEDGKKLGLLGPRSATDRIAYVRTARHPVNIEITHADGVYIDVEDRIRKNPREENSGEQLVLSHDLAEPSIKELIRMYIKEALGKDEQEHVETPDEFFDMDVDDEETLPLSGYEIDDMPDEYPAHRPGKVEEPTPEPAVVPEKESNSSPPPKEPSSLEEQAAK